jgi:small subunit ribosomal protein S11
MARLIKKISLRKTKKKSPKGVIHIQASFNNTIVTITDLRGQVISWSSSGACGFKGAKKSTAYAAQITAESAIKQWTDQNIKQAEIMMSGPGPGRETALRAIRNSRVMLSFIRDVTPIPHNGCRPPKKRRV